MTGDAFFGPVVGIDPGLTGAVALVSGDGRAVSVDDMPVVTKGKGGHDLDLPALRDLLRDLAPERVYVERQQARPGNGACAAHTAGRIYGAILGILTALELPYELVTPQRWKKAMLDGEPKDDSNPKAPSLRVARRLFPLVDLGRRKDAGRAEALLIAEWGRRAGGAG